MFFFRKLKIFRIHYNDPSNQFIRYLPNGKKIVNPRFARNIHIKFCGKNATLEIHEPCNLYSSKFILFDNDNFVIKQTVGDIFVMGGVDTGNARLLINEGCSLNSTEFYLNSCPNASITLGRDCMFSTHISVWASDTHKIVDAETGKQLNNIKNGVQIGNHVWVGTRAIILKNTIIPDNCIVGAGSVVTGKFDTPNAIIAGNRATVVRTGINWVRDAISDE